jgi:hypothetical protein
MRKWITGPLALGALIIGIAAPASATAPEPDIERLPTQMKVADVHRPKITAVPGTRIVLKYSNIFDTATGKVLRNVRGAQPGHRYRVSTEVVYNRFEKQQVTESVVVSPAVPDRTVTKTWTQDQCELTGWTPYSWTASQTSWQKRRDMSGPPPGVWRTAYRVTGIARGWGGYTCSYPNGEVRYFSGNVTARIAWTPSDLDDYLFAYGVESNVGHAVTTLDNVIPVSQEEFGALKASIYWESANHYDGCDDNWWTPCGPQPNEDVYHYAYKNALSAPPHNDSRTGEIRAATKVSTLQRDRMTWSETYVIPGHPAEIETRTWTENVQIAGNVTKHSTQYFRAR